MCEPSRLILSFFIAGFQYYDGALVLSRLKSGESGLALVPEPDNPHDPDAVAIYFGSHKMGFVPGARMAWHRLCATTVTRTSSRCEYSR